MSTQFDDGRDGGMREKPLKIVAGEYYRMRQGAKKGPMQDYYGDGKVWSDGRNAWHADGKWDPNKETDNDLISLWTDEPAQPHWSERERWTAAEPKPQFCEYCGGRASDPCKTFQESVANDCCPTGDVKQFDPHTGARVVEPKSDHVPGGIEMVAETTYSVGDEITLRVVDIYYGKPCVDAVRGPTSIRPEDIIRHTRAPRPIEVGCLVKWHFTNEVFKVVAKFGNSAWAHIESGGMPQTFPIEELSRIDSEAA